MKARHNIHRSEKEWKLILQDFERSDLTQDQYCKHHNLPTSTFSKWKNQLNHPSIPCSSDFIEVQPGPPLSTKKLADSIARFELSINLSRWFQLNLKIA